MSDLTDIQHTVIQAVPSNVAQAYPEYIEPVITALQRREDEVKDRLRTIAMNHGLSAAAADAVLAEAGLLDSPAPTTLEDSEDPEDKVRSLIGELVNSLNDILKKGN